MIWWGGGKFTACSNCIPPTKFAEKMLSETCKFLPQKFLPIGCIVPIDLGLHTCMQHVCRGIVRRYLQKLFKSHKQNLSMCNVVSLSLCCGCDDDDGVREGVGWGQRRPSST